MNKLLSLLIIPFLFLFMLSRPAGAQVTEASTAAVGETQVEYELPYPGILPDHPLYVLKQVRDWVLDKLIADPIKKVEFNILQADKRLNAGLMLQENGKNALAEQVISKGEKYMNNAITLLLSLKAQGKDIPAYLTDRLEKALAKHEELLENTEFTGSLDLVQSMQESLKNFKE